MAEQLLDVSNLRSVPEHQSGRCVAEDMAGRRLAYLCSLDIASHKPCHVSPGEVGALKFGDKERLFRGVFCQSVSHFIDVFLHPLQCPLSHRDKALPSTLAFSYVNDMPS